MPLEPSKNRSYRLGSDQFVNNLPAPQHHHDRNATHSKTSRQGRIIPGIYLHHHCLAGNSLGYCSHRRCE